MPPSDVVLITGATSGIGWETSLAFAAAGAQVIGTGRDQTRLMALAPRVAQTLTLDVTDADAVEIAAQAALDARGRVDVLVNNAGIGLFKDWAETTPADVRRVMEVNLLGAMAVTAALLPQMIERGSGVIVNVASVAGHRGYPKHTAYCASKHALIGYSRALRKDLDGTGVNVVVISPPAVSTPFFQNAGYLTFDDDHPGLVPMTPQEAARHIVEATRRRERQRVLGRRARILHTLDQVAPGLVDGLQRVQRWQRRR